MTIIAIKSFSSQIRTNKLPNFYLPVIDIFNYNSLKMFLEKNPVKTKKIL